MTGISTWTDITIHRSCLLRRGRGSGSLRTGKPGPIGGLYRSKAVAISSLKLSVLRIYFLLGADFGLRIEVERKGPQ
jgi:hypothetical protein